MDFTDLVRARRSVRTFSDKPIDDSVVSEVVECARLAPSWKNWQCWHFIVVRDRAKIEQLVVDGAVMGNKWISKAPALVVACGEPAKSGDMHEIPYYAVDVTIALDHLVLAATERGLGTCWVGIFDAEKLGAILGVPDDVRIVAITPLGYPADGMSVQERLARLSTGDKRRKPLAEIIHFEKW